jgi:hypothetical protein
MLIKAAYFLGWDGAKLLHHTHTIHLAPKFHQLAILNTDDVDHAKGYVFAGGRDTQKLAPLGAAPGHGDSHRVAIDENVINCGFKIWEGAAHHGGQLFDALAVIRFARWELFVVGFLVSEVGELADALVSSAGNWVRNNPDREKDIEGEAGDVLMMLCVTLMERGIPHHENKHERSRVYTCARNYGRVRVAGITPRDAEV